MGAVRWIWVGSIAAAVLAAAAVVAIAHSGGSGGSGPAPAARVDASLDHTAVDFGDPVTATVTVTAPDDAAIDVAQDLAPLTQLGRTRVTRVSRSGTQTVTYAARGSCIDDRCLATSGVKRVALRPATVTIGGRKTTAVWPILKVQRRVDAGGRGAGATAASERHDAAARDVPRVARSAGHRSRDRRGAARRGGRASRRRDGGSDLPPTPDGPSRSPASSARSRSPATPSGDPRPTGAARSSCSRACSGRATRRSPTKPSSSRGRSPRPPRSRSPTS